MEIGRICVKIAGRDAGKYCVILNQIDGNTVLIDGQTRRKNCNTKHLEPTKKIIKITEKSTTEQIIQEFNKTGIKSTTKTKKKEKSAKTEKPKKKRYQKTKSENTKTKKTTDSKKEGQKGTTQNKKQEQTNQSS